MTVGLSGEVSGPAVGKTVGTDAAAGSLLDGWAARPRAEDLSRCSAQDLASGPPCDSSLEPYGGAGRWWGQPSWVERRGQDLDAVDQAGAWTGAVGAGVDRHVRLDTSQLGTPQQAPSRLLDGRLEAVAAGHEHHHLGRRSLDLRPGHPHRRATRTGKHRLGPSDLEHLRHPV